MEAKAIKKPLQKNLKKMMPKMSPNCSQKGGEIEAPRAQEYEKSSNIWTDPRKVSKMDPKGTPKVSWNHQNRFQKASQNEVPKHHNKKGPADCAERLNRSEP